MHVLVLTMGNYAFRAHVQYPQVVVPIWTTAWTSVCVLFYGFNVLIIPLTERFYGKHTLIKPSTGGALYAMSAGPMVACFAMAASSQLKLASKFNLQAHLFLISSIGVLASICLAAFYACGRKQ